MDLKKKRSRVEEALKEAIEANDRPRARYLEHVLLFADLYREEDPTKIELSLDHPFRGGK